MTIMADVKIEPGLDKQTFFIRVSSGGWELGNLSFNRIHLEWLMGCDFLTDDAREMLKKALQS